MKENKKKRAGSGSEFVGGGSGGSGGGVGGYGGGLIIAGLLRGVSLCACVRLVLGLRRPARRLGDQVEQLCRGDPAHYSSNSNFEVVLLFS